MPLFMYRCPKTGYRVQGFSAEDTSEDRHVYEPVTCPVCHQIHHVNQTTRATLEEKVEGGCRNWQALLSFLAVLLDQSFRRSNSGSLAMLAAMLPGLCPWLARFSKLGDGQIPTTSPPPAWRCWRRYAAPSRNVCRPVRRGARKPRRMACVLSRWGQAKKPGKKIRHVGGYRCEIRVDFD